MHDDLAKRVFIAYGPSQSWLTDITEHWTAREGKLYLCAIKDVWSNRIVEVAIDDRMKASLAVRALDNVVLQRGYPEGVIVHSDRGTRLGFRKFRSALKGHGLHGSMGHAGTCEDNAEMESFFSLLQKNVLGWQSWASQQELRLAIVS